MGHAQYRRTDLVHRLLFSMYAAGSAVGASSCGPDISDDAAVDLPSVEGAQYAKAVCDALAKCECGAVFESMSGCEQDYHARFDESLVAGFRVVPSCFEKWQAEIAEAPCGEKPLVAGSPVECAPLRGARREGETCGVLSNVVALRADECAEGLLCRDARCIQTPALDGVPLTRLDEGDPCGPTYTGFCFEGLFCDSEAGACKATIPPGSVCSAGSVCDSCSASSGNSTYVCEQTQDGVSGTCQSPPRRGDYCDPRVSWGCGTCDDVAWCDPVSLVCGGLDRPPSLLCLWAYQ